MSRPRALVPVILILLLVAPAIAAGPGNGNGQGPAGPRAGGPPIHNKVLDLLDDEVFLESDGETASWISAPFATGRFNRIVLKPAAEAENGSLLCYTQWKFGPDDEFQRMGPPATIIGDDINPRVLPPTGADAQLVYGLLARVRCDMLAPPDFGGGDPPAPATGSLTDLKVLLRRE